MQAELPRTGNSQVATPAHYKDTSLDLIITNLSSLIILRLYCFSNITFLHLSLPAASSLLPGSWWGIRVTSVTPAALTARWARSGRWASPKPTAWCFLRRPPRARQTSAWAVDEVMGRCRISRTRWRTLLSLSVPNWRDRRNLQQQTFRRTTAPLKSGTRKDQRKSCGPAAERERRGTVGLLRWKNVTFLALFRRVIVCECMFVWIRELPYCA